MVILSFHSFLIIFLTVSAITFGQSGSNSSSMFLALASLSNSLSPGKGIFSWQKSHIAIPTDHTSVALQEYPSEPANWCSGPLKPGVPVGKYEISSLPLNLTVVKSTTIIQSPISWVSLQRMLSTLMSLLVMLLSCKYLTPWHSQIIITLIMSPKWSVLYFLPMQSTTFLFLLQHSSSQLQFINCPRVPSQFIVHILSLPWIIYRHLPMFWCLSLFSKFSQFFSTSRLFAKSPSAAKNLCFSSPYREQIFIAQSWPPLRTWSTSPKAPCPNFWTTWYWLYISLLSSSKVLFSSQVQTECDSKGGSCGYLSEDE